MQRVNAWVGIRVGVFVLATLPFACFKGADREKEAPPGNVGGLCLAPDGHCNEGECNKSENYCFDRASPCSGFFCGGSERGVCQPTADLEPSCVCMPGFNNDDFSLYCCPDNPLEDPENCLPPDGSVDDDEDTGVEGSSGGA